VGEFDLIERIRARVTGSSSVPVGIGDDAAIITPTPGQALAVTTDSIVLDRHFTAAWSTADVGHLALAVNLSDLAAMGAKPRWALLALTLPEGDVAWLDGFLDGFLGLADEFGVSLVGGNISAGSLNIGVQLLGEVDPAIVAHRQGARAGDVLAVTGTLGDAAAALKLGQRAGPGLQSRLRRPQARVAAGIALAAEVDAMIDISDGLLADLAHLLGSGLGARVSLGQLPASDSLVEAIGYTEQRWPLQLGGGNDYELLVALAPDRLDSATASCRSLGLALTPIGEFNDSGIIECVRPDNTLMEIDHDGWDHFKT
jgi:thiamine-monophosphate kinase